MKLAIIYFTIFCFKLSAQINPINIAENTLKIPGMNEVVLYYSFAEGDQLIFNFQELTNKELKELEILEYPSNSRFMEYKTKKIENKSISIPRSGVYIFRFKNTTIFGRICKIKIDRISASDKTLLFNTSVKWIDKPDTIWNIYTKEIVVGYDTLLIPRTKKELIRGEQYEEIILDKNERVHSISSLKGINKTAVFLTLPTNTFSELTSKRIISWGYWVGVGEESNKAWQKNCKLMSGLVTTMAGAITTPLGGLLAGKMTELIVPKIGEIVSYGLVDSQNKDFFFQGMQYRGLDFGKGRAGYKKFIDENVLSGTWYIILLNDNITQGIDVNVKVVALIEKNTYEYRAYTEQKVTARYENKIFRDPIIKYNKIPTLVN